LYSTSGTAREREQPRRCSEAVLYTARHHRANCQNKATHEQTAHSLAQSRPAPPAVHPDPASKHSAASLIADQSSAASHRAAPHSHVRAQQAGTMRKQRLHSPARTRPSPSAFGRCGAQLVRATTDGAWAPRHLARTGCRPPTAAERAQCGWARNRMPADSFLGPPHVARLKCR
jgi:hypothetical protein